MSAAAASSSPSSSPFPVHTLPRPYNVTKFCQCKKEISPGSCSKCLKCHWNYCNKHCRKQFSKEHKLTCDVNRVFNSFFETNLKFFSVFGAWLRFRDDFDFVGMCVEIQEDPTLDVRATPINKQSLDILSQEVHGEAEMYKLGYPDVFILVIDWKGCKIFVEIDLVVPTPDHEVTDVTNVGRILLGDTKEFDVDNAGRFIVTPVPLPGQETRNGWMQSWMQNKSRPPLMVPRSYTGFRMWNELRTQSK